MLTLQVTVPSTNVMHAVYEKTLTLLLHPTHVATNNRISYLLSVINPAASIISRITYLLPLI